MHGHIQKACAGPCYLQHARANICFQVLWSLVTSLQHLLNCSLLSDRPLFIYYQTFIKNQKYSTPELPYPKQFPVPVSMMQNLHSACSLLQWQTTEVQSTPPAPRPGEEGASYCSEAGGATRRSVSISPWPTVILSPWPTLWAPGPRRPVTHWGNAGRG